MHLKKSWSSSNADFYVQGVVKNHFENWFGTEEKNLVIHLTFAKQHQLLWTSQKTSNKKSIVKRNEMEERRQMYICCIEYSSMKQPQ